jgi:16S rRNA (adenine1518-N6/adenine1519-N6)-dimethyltransferase
MSSEDLRHQARDFNAKKRLGQNFLINPDALARIAKELQIVPGENVIEIGSGLGFLTAILVGAGANVTAVELDPECVETVTELNLPRLKILHEDFLKSDLNLILDQKSKVIGNIPYNITTPILARLFGEIDQPSQWLNKIDSVVLTVQREVALRLVAQAGEEDYSQISILVNYFAKSEILFYLPPEDFVPIPEVTSAVVRLVPHKEPPISCCSMRLMRQIVQAGFRQRRKMLKNNLGFLNIGQDVLLRVFDKLNFDPQVRAETMGLRQFALLTDEIHECKEYSAKEEDVEIKV